MNTTAMQNTTGTFVSPATQHDYLLSIAAGTLIGLLALPILATARPSLYQSIWPLVPVFFIFASPAGLFVAAQLSRFIRIIWQLAKFVLIGGLNTLVDLGVLALLTTVFKTHFSLTPASVVFSTTLGMITAFSFYKGASFIVANINSYFWNRFWTFSGTASQEKTSTQFLQFLIVSLIGFLINIFVASYVFTAIPAALGSNAAQWGLIGGACGAIASLGWNFVGYKFIVFNR